VEVTVRDTCANTVYTGVYLVTNLKGKTLTRHTKRCGQWVDDRKVNRRPRLDERPATTFD